jgi:predicted aspartyl protease/transposase InsO family protein
MDLSIGDRTVPCLIDTGSAVSLLPLDCVEHIPLDCYNGKVTAANGSEMKIIDWKLFKIKLNGHPFAEQMLVSDEIEEAMIGTDFLLDHDCQLDLKQAILTVDSKTLHLHSRGRREKQCRRVYCEQTVIIPPHTQQDIKIRIPRRNLRDTANDWLINSTQIRSGVVVANTVVPDHAADTIVRVCNVTAEEVSLRRGLHIADAKSVTVVDKNNKAATATREPENRDQNGRDISTAADTDRAKKINQIIRDVTEKLPTAVDSTIKQALVNLLQKYENVLSVDAFDLGYTDIIKHRIDTGNHRPVREQLRRHPLPHLEYIDDQVQQMLKAKIIEPAQVEWASNVCLARRKDGGLRFAIDYRRLNRLTTGDSYPIPRIDSCLDVLNGSAWFSTLDLRCGFWQVAQDERDADKTTFVTRRGSFRFRVLSFGLQGSPSLFQRVMDLVLAGLTWDCCLVYIDDIVIFSRTQAEHIDRLEQVLRRLKEHNLKLKPDKCQFLQQSVSFLDYVVSGKGISLDERKTRTILQLQRPKNLKELRSYIGCFSFYRKFISSFSVIAEAIYALTRKGVKFEWTQKQEESFEILKKKLSQAPVLALPRDDAQTVLNVDACDTRVGAVLSQIINGEERPIAYASRTLNDAERRYCITRREMISLIFGLKTFRQYCLGRNILIRADHAPLLSIQKSPSPSAQMCRWLDFLQVFNFTIQHRPGLRHGNADGCSRATTACKQCHLSAASYQRLDEQAQNGSMKHVRVVRHRSTDLHPSMDIATAQREDPDIRPVIEAMETSSDMPPWNSLLHYSEDSKNLFAQWPTLQLINGLDGHRQVKWLQCVIPCNLRKNVLQQVHAGLTSGHFGRRKTTQLLARRAYWKSWRKDCINFVRQCQQCQSFLRGQPPRNGELQDMTVASPMERAGIDLTGPWPKSHNNTFILTFIDHFTKWADAVPIPNQVAHTVAKALVEKIFTQVGCVLQLVSDQGKEFDNQVTTEICHRLHIDKTRTTPYKPSTNASVERMHRTMHSIFAKMIDNNQHNRSELLPFVMAAYRSAPHDSTGFSPNFLHFGREVRAPIDLILETPNSDGQIPMEYADVVAERLRPAYTLVREQLGVQAERRKKYYDTKLKPSSFHVNDWVWLYTPRRRPGKSIKWQRLYNGPFLIIDQIGPVNYVIQRSPRAEPKVVHVDKLKLFLGDTPESWLSTTRNDDDANGQNRDTLWDTDIPAPSDAENYRRVAAGTAARSDWLNRARGLYEY